MNLEKIKKALLECGYLTHLETKDNGEYYEFALYIRADKKKIKKKLENN